MKINCAYFSPAHTTEKVAKYIAKNMGDVSVSFDLIRDNDKSLTFEKNDVLVVAVPVYCGRIPATSVPMLEKLNGNGAKAVISVVYGNIHIGDAMRELFDILKKQNFEIIGAGAFIAQHSMAPKVAKNRPDADDFKIMDEFVAKCKNNLADKNFVNACDIVGNFPYTKPPKLPAYPLPTKDCTNCGLCAKFCPAGAIDSEDFSKVDHKKCISCMACVDICPKNSRKVNPIISIFAKSGLGIAGIKRKEPIWFA